MCNLKLYFSIASIYVFSLKKTRADDYAGECGPVGVRISEEVPCYINDNPTKCLSSYNDGTIIVKRCRPAYMKGDRKNVTYKCDFDRWRAQSEICRPDCGSQTRQNKYPWIVAIYNTNEELICTGTIVTTYHVLTAAHCFRPVHQNITTAKDYIIIAGKHYANLQRNKATMQRRKIADLTLHHTYKDAADTRMGDIALLEVNIEFVLDDDVRPACMDWNTVYEEWDFYDGNEGIAVGRQSVNAEVIPCQDLDTPNIQYWQSTTCLRNLPHDYPYAKIEEDKFCAEYIDGDSTCGRDVGSGVFFKSDYKRYFLRGITSVVDSNSDYILYTKVSYYIKWLQQQLSVKYLFSFPTIEDKDGKSTDNGCLLPDDNQYGKFSLTIGRKYTKGKWVSPATTILLHCNGRKDNPVLFQCVNSEWFPSIEKVTCRKPGTCPPIEATKSEEVFCNLNGHSVNCEDAQPNTVAVVRCKLFFTFSGHSPVYKCQDGEWDQTFAPCIPECGLKRTGVVALLIGANDTVMNEYPWVVAIYNAMDEHICGGTIISRHFVLTAAHCFTNSRGILAQKEDFTIIAGKYFRDIKIREQAAQIRKIKSLFIHEDFKASLRKYRDDIALVQVHRAFKLTSEVEPACVDWEGAYEAIDLVEGNKGIVTGWGYTEEGGVPSTQLQKITVQYQPQDACVRYLPRNFFDQYATTDKICAGEIGKSTNVCKGDSGGGLYFQSDRSRYFIRGIVSLTVKSETGCDKNQLALYTKVSKYLPWMENITKKML